MAGGSNQDCFSEAEKHVGKKNPCRQVRGEEKKMKRLI